MSSIHRSINGSCVNRECSRVFVITGAENTDELGLLAFFTLLKQEGVASSSILVLQHVYSVESFGMDDGLWLW